VPAVERGAVPGGGDPASSSAPREPTPTAVSSAPRPRETTPRAVRRLLLACVPLTPGDNYDRRRLHRRFKNAGPGVIVEERNAR